MISRVLVSIRETSPCETLQQAVSRATHSNGPFKIILNIVYYSLILPAIAIDKFLGNKESPLPELVLRSIKSAVVLKKDDLMENINGFWKRNRVDILWSIIMGTGVTFLISPFLKNPPEKPGFNKGIVAVLGGLLIAGSITFIKANINKNPPTELEIAFTELEIAFTELDASCLALKNAKALDPKFNEFQTAYLLQKAKIASLMHLQIKSIQDPKEKILFSDLVKTMQLPSPRDRWHALDQLAKECENQKSNTTTILLKKLLSETYDSYMKFIMQRNPNALNKS